MTIADDLLEGVDAIAAELGWPTDKVYRARQKGWGIPIHKKQGLGLYAFRSELLAWLRTPDPVS